MNETVKVGMDAIVNELNSGLSVTTLWSTVGSVVPFIITTTLFALGFYLVKRAINKAKKAKGGM